VYAVFSIVADLCGGLEEFSFDSVFECFFPLGGAYISPYSERAFLR